MKILLYSNAVVTKKRSNTYQVKDEVHLITQYYHVNNSKKRQDEIDNTLLLNSINSNISKIHLLNEKIYDLKHFNSIKIIQKCISKRLTFTDVFEYIINNNIQGYIIISNADIFFDNTLINIHNTTLSLNKEIICQLRDEFKDTNTPSMIFGPRYDSHDTWILHSNHSILLKHCNVFNFCFGTPGCNNKLIYLFKILEYILYNDPLCTKTYHNHNSQVRN